MTGPSARLTGSGTWGRWMLLATAITQAASPALSGFTGESASDPVVVPPGPFFAIWGLIVIGCAASALWGLPRERATSAPYARIHWPVSLAQLGFTAWLLAAVSSPAWSVPIFLVMLVCLGTALRIVVTTPTESPTRWLLGTSLGLYTGWAAAAVWVNIATVLPEAARTDTVYLGLLLLGAVISLSVGAVVFRAHPAFIAAGAWALLGVVVSTMAAGAGVLSLGAGAGLAVLAVAAVVVRRRRGEPMAAALPRP
ncbi:hypothetical protein GMA12_11470 [Kocuria sediminis]|uniref:Tryptophan-rich sensory protein n=1 Tax=Kocuria sediminis TaxID=1038857 RepID=A0A6N8GSE6_9MICC|nr:hypothetical protein [Kocuria sediminis]MUN63754.1 hypothetical protein [Kocuria sediminis]